MKCDHRGPVVVAALAAAALGWGVVVAGELQPGPFHEVWEEEVPVMGHLAVVMDGTVLVFKEERMRKRVEVKRSGDEGGFWPFWPCGGSSGEICG